MTGSPSTQTQPFDESVNTRIHGLLFKRKITKKTLTHAVGVSQPTGSKKLNGHVPWTANELAVVAAILETSVAYLYGEVDDDAPLRKTKNAPTDSSERSDSVAGAGIEPATSRL